MADEVRHAPPEMVVVDGVRYRPEDDPRKSEAKDEPTQDPARKQRTRVQNKARTVAGTDNK